MKPIKDRRGLEDVSFVTLEIGQGLIIGKNLITIMRVLNNNPFTVELQINQTLDSDDVNTI